MLQLLFFSFTPVNSIPVRYCFHIGKLFLFFLLSWTFYQAYGRKKFSSRKKTNKAISAKKIWNRPFRTDYICNQLTDQHQERCEEYTSLSDCKKRSYFDVAVTYAETVLVHFGLSADCILETTYCKIVNVMLNDLLDSRCNSNDMTEKTKNILSCDCEMGSFKLKIKKLRRLSMVVGLVYHGILFGDFASTLRFLCSSASLAFTGNISEDDVSSYERA